MKPSTQLGVYGALLLALCLIGYALYELLFYPNAGFPTTDFAVIVAGANTLRIGHWLKFGYMLSIALLMTSMQPRLQRASPTLAQLGLLAGSSAIVLFLASGHIGLRILATAEATFATNPAEAIATILLRTVTIALFEDVSSPTNTPGMTTTRNCRCGRVFSLINRISHDSGD
jgi:hypothetical protein